MFTGIIEELGILKDIKKENGFSVIEVECNTVLNNTKVGDSISTNGICLTVKELNDNSFKADVMGETLERSSLGSLKEEDRVNLERALSLQHRLGGHIVSGHVDGTGIIQNIEKKSDGTWFAIKASKEILRYIVYKGSITIDGISLTVAYVDDSIFKVSVIPHTLEYTNLCYKKINSIVNLECDVIGKYVEKLINGKKEEDTKESRINMNFLSRCGF